MQANGTETDLCGVIIVSLYKMIRFYRAIDFKSDSSCNEMGISDGCHGVLASPFLLIKRSVGPQA